MGYETTYVVRVLVADERTINISATEAHEAARRALEVPDVISVVDVRHSPDKDGAEPLWERKPIIPYA